MRGNGERLADAGPGEPPAHLLGMSTDINGRTHQQAGVRSGGQYATEAKTESGVTLHDATPPVQGVPITASGTYSRYEIPPRCRTERWVEHQVQATGTLRSVSSQEAPLAFEISPQVGWASGKSLRTFDGQLYEPISHGTYYARSIVPDGRLGTPLTLDDDELRSALEHNPYLERAHSTAESDETWAAKLQEHLDRFLLVDGQAYRHVGEPRYVVMTFGLGRNNGGTSLFVETEDNSNIAADSYFRADQFEQARDYAIQVAQSRGDTVDAGRLANAEPLIAVHDPAAIRLVVPQQESTEVGQARRVYRDAVDRMQTASQDASNTGADAAWSTLVAARERLASMTDDIAGEGRVRRPYEER